jgi:hypothetical protein
MLCKIAFRLNIYDDLTSIWPFAAEYINRALYQEIASFLRCGYVRTCFFDLVEQGDWLMSSKLVKP